MKVALKNDHIYVGTYALVIWPGVILSRKGEPCRAVNVYPSGNSNVLQSHFQFWTSPKSVGWKEER